ncbi:hypothetical protein CROQUDRAFT_133014 [Cronartium quercuum f. sp. fusiforme G11]|uniref:Uncharacterized protein n=1 Tax=Cronartium quercuum f. sp. fusiforme G11 TaxID=708437 RepID=A0A9P6TDD6_9BASI|nr:hypothetical protein CROQUDRAFT_133014 [Cronartium quercuum f. sp. fusiforme G11]
MTELFPPSQSSQKSYKEKLLGGFSKALSSLRRFSLKRPSKSTRKNDLPPSPQKEKCPSIIWQSSQSTSHGLVDHFNTPCASTPRPRTACGPIGPFGTPHPMTARGPIGPFGSPRPVTARGPLTLRCRALVRLYLTYVDTH